MRDFVFGKDVFLKTDHPTAVDSEDGWSPPEEAAQYFNKPLSFMCDFYEGETFASALLKEFPGKNKLLDLGTATGSVPLTMRNAGMKALGLDGLDVGKNGGIDPSMLPPGHTSNNSADPCSARFAWNVAPEIVDCCDITKPFRIEDASGNLVKFDFIYSADCFEHLVTERVPVLVDNIYDHLDDDGYGIFEISTGVFCHIHQTVKPLEWWKEMFATRFTIDEMRTNRDYSYTRSRMLDGQLRYISTNDVDGFKILFWVRKK